MNRRGRTGRQRPGRVRRAQARHHARHRVPQPDLCSRPARGEASAGRARAHGCDSSGWHAASTIPAACRQASWKIRSSSSESGREKVTATAWGLSASRPTPRQRRQSGPAVGRTSTGAVRFGKETTAPIRQRTRHGCASRAPGADKARRRTGRQRSPTGPWVKTWWYWAGVGGFVRVPFPLGGPSR